MSEQKQKLFKFKGSVVKSIYKSDDFSVYALDIDKKAYPEIKLNKYGNVGICGELHDLIADVEYDIEATEQETKYGTSYKVYKIKRDEPTTKEETYLFLREILTEAQATTIIENYPNIISLVKEDKFDVIDVTKLKGIGEKSLGKIKTKIIENFYLMDLVAEFGNILSLNMLKRIYDRYSSVETLKHKLKVQPYTTLTMVSGIGFKKADAIVLELQKANIIDFGYDVKTSPDRCLSCLLYLLEENENSGHTKMNLVQLRKECLGLVPSCINHFTDVIKHEDIYYDKDKVEVALKKTYETECYIANTILENVKNETNVWNYDVEQYREVGSFKLSDEQLRILDVVCKNNISILNGFGGSGKTASTQGLVKMLKDNNKSFKLMSPTGKAAKVLAENTKEITTTVHRGLGYVPPHTWTFDSSNPLCCDIVIVDEFSMVDIWLFKRLLDAIDFRFTKLLLIGDNAQLPSVSAGNLLHDFMETEVIPTVTLTKIFRYSEGGLMKAATDTRCCKRYLRDDMKSKATTFGSNKDYTFVDLASESIPSQIVALYKKLMQEGHHIEDIQVLTSKNVGNYGTVVLNNMIQKVANPNYGSEVNMKIGETTYYEGDLVLQKANNYEAELDVRSLSYEDLMMYDETPTAFVANGETGVIKEIYNTYAIIDFDGVLVKYYKNNMNDVGLGYAITIHKSQGSSIKIVILCTPQADTYMLNSNLLYVGLTRMKEKLYHLGTLDTVNIAIKKKENLNRNTFMKDLLKKTIDK